MDTKYIQRRDHKWRVVFPQSILQERYLGSFDTIEEAQADRDRYLENARLAQDESPEISGFTNQDGDPEPQRIWDQLIENQSVVERNALLRSHQKIVIKDDGKPFGIAYFSDLHLGDPATDYRAILADAELVESNPRLWAGYHGDGLNSWLLGKLQTLQRSEIVPYDQEIAAFADWLRMVGPSLLWVVAGNHDNWTAMLTGIDLPRTLLKNVRVLYDRYEVTFLLEWGSNSLNYKVRHKWKYNSIFNVTHSIEVGWQRGDSDFDIGLGGHTHIGTVERPFFRHGNLKRAILTGTYKILPTGGSFGKELGLASPMGTGCGAHVFDGQDITFCDNLEKAVKLIERLS